MGCFDTVKRIGNMEMKGEDMVNGNLKKTVITAVEEQLASGECPFVREAFEELLDRGYSERQAKEKIGAVMLESIYDILSEKKDYDENQYRARIEEVLKADFEDGDKWDKDLYADEESIWRGTAKALDKGKALFEKNRMDECLAEWEPVWERLKQNVSVTAETYGKLELYNVDEATEFRYEFEEWLPQVITAYFALHKYEEAIRFCKEVKETFAWRETAANEYNASIGNALFYMNDYEASDAWFERWQTEEPKNFECAYEAAFHWFRREQPEKAKAVMEEAMEGVECTYETQDIYSRAAGIFSMLGDTKQADYYRKAADDFFKKFLKNPTRYGPQEQFDEDAFFFAPDGFQQCPIVKDAKIYPNDPCPCGSGKKYKKCCGKRANGK